MILLDFQKPKIVLAKFGFLKKEENAAIELVSMLHNFLTVIYEVS
jgi:hypothetical protein